MITATEGREAIRRLALTVVKAKSNSEESIGWETACLIDPTLEQTADMILATELRLGPDECGMMDAANLFLLAQRHPIFEIMYLARWEEMMPDAMTLVVGS